LPGTCVTVTFSLIDMVPPHNGHSLLAGMNFVLCKQTLALACRLDKPVIGSYR
jgi:hypothetical protein